MGGANAAELPLAGLVIAAGLVGFGITIIALSFVADRVGYGPLIILAFLLHFSAAVVTLLATPVPRALEVN